MRLTYTCLQEGDILTDFFFARREQQSSTKKESNRIITKRINNPCLFVTGNRKHTHPAVFVMQEVAKTGSIPSQHPLNEREGEQMSFQERKMSRWRRRKAFLDSRRKGNETVTHSLNDRLTPVRDSCGRQE